MARGGGSVCISGGNSSQQDHFGRRLSSVQKLHSASPMGDGAGMNIPLDMTHIRLQVGFGIVLSDVLNDDVIPESSESNGLFPSDTVHPINNALLSAVCLVAGFIG